MTSSMLTLFCLIDGETIFQAFSVEIASSGTISNLKVLIVKGDQAPAFRDVAPKDVILWRTSILDDKLDSVITVDSLDEKTELKNPRTWLSKLFPESPDDTTYILVKPPSQTRSDEKAKQLSDNNMVQVAVVVKPKESVAFTWPTFVDTATLDDFKDYLYEDYPQYAHEKALEIYMYNEHVSDDEGLRQVLKAARKTTSEIKLTVSLETPNKEFSAWTFKEVCQVYGISEDDPPLLEDIPEFADTEAAALDSDLEIKTLTELKAEVETFVDVMILECANIATISLIVGVFLAKATRLFKQDLFLACQRKISGPRGNGLVDFSVHSRQKNRSYALVVTLVKSEDFEQAVAQNFVQLESVASKKHNKRSSCSLVTRSYGVVTDASTWMLTECAIDQGVTFRRTKLDKTISYLGNWQVDAEFIFKRLVWLWSRMVDDEISTRKDKDIGPPQKKPRTCST